MPISIEVRSAAAAAYPDVFSPAALDALRALSHFDDDRRAVMAARIARRAARARARERIGFLDPHSVIPHTSIRVQDARDGRFTGADIPSDLQRQWIQGTGPGAKPGVSIEKSIRNIAYALLSGADGWMFDGEDALGQISTMSLDNQRNLMLANADAPVFLGVCEQVAREMNQ
ncbi:MAG TPA: hypothetical protein VG871_07655, partial [Vicinamibacterales bacterium]|nr:hypothetical protein [Vicinamibacterales bacterium]